MSENMNEQVVNEVVEEAVKNERLSFTQGLIIAGYTFGIAVGSVVAWNHVIKPVGGKIIGKIGFGKKNKDETIDVEATEVEDEFKEETEK